MSVVSSVTNAQVSETSFSLIGGFARGLAVSYLPSSCFTSERRRKLESGWGLPTFDHNIVKATFPPIERNCRRPHKVWCKSNYCWLFCQILIQGNSSLVDAGSRPLSYVFTGTLHPKQAKRLIKVKRLSAVVVEGASGPRALMNVIDEVCP